MLAVVPTPSAALDTGELRKARGAFFTPEPVARYITDWAVRSTAAPVITCWSRPCTGRSFTALSGHCLGLLLRQLQHGESPKPSAARA